ncbi:MAG: acetamidase/formamidase family protein [Anaerolineae bacterium]|nr:acetamidase/formamidase family protein [Anaerolineae bacterium]
MSKEHYLDSSAVHNVWDNSIEPRLHIDPGDTVIFECVDASGQQVTPDSQASDLTQLDFGKVNPLTGPVYVDGAEPGDTLKVEILDLKHKGWGWTGIIPGFGLLADEFPEPYLKIWQLEEGSAEFKPGIRIPLEPFCGSMGVAPRVDGPIGTVAPTEHGGNLDTRGLVKGTVLYLPVWVPGALFSCGDCHAAQGDGEVCGTGIESPMTVTLRLGLVKGASISEFRFETPSPLTKTDTQGYYVTTAHGPDLYKNAQQAIRYMVDYLSAEHGLTRPEAYALCSVAVDLKISEIVDAPNFIVSAYLPKSIFTA